jgi:hypothetical protein
MPKKVSAPPIHIESGPPPEFTFEKKIVDLTAALTKTTAQINENTQKITDMTVLLELVLKKLTK